MKKSNANKLLFCIISFVLNMACHAESVDVDSDGLIEINNLNDLNEIRNDVTGKTFRGSSDGCPSTDCFGWELTRDLNFDSNGNDVIDAGDWNGGQSWVPFNYMNRVVFEGHSHSISNLLMTTPKIVANTSYLYGLFSQLQNSNIRNLRLIKPTNYKIIVGALTGRLDTASQLVNCVVDNASVNFNRPSILAPLQFAGAVGGVVGVTHGPQPGLTTLGNVHFSGSVNVQDSLVNHPAGGLLVP